MPTMASAKQPTIAIITAQYCEKLAVDSMIENKETFVRYTTVGKIHCFFVSKNDNPRVVTLVIHLNNAMKRKLIFVLIRQIVEFSQNIRKNISTDSPLLFLLNIRF